MEKKYFTEEERKAAHREDAKRDYYKHKQERLERAKERYKSNPEVFKERLYAYNKTKYGRALYILNGYKRLDKKYNRGECTLTAQWIIDNIFSKSCHYCGENDWHKLGCDRIDNAKPHTEDNVVSCCEECNTKRGKKSYEEFINNTVKINDK